MKKTGLSILLSLFLSILSFSVWAEIIPEEKHNSQIRLIDSFLANHHYQGSVLDDAKSAEILDKYLENLDYGKYAFTQEDITHFKKLEFVLDNLSHKGNLEPVFDIYNTYAKKREEQAQWALKRLKATFNENEKGTIELDREKVNWAKDKDELQQRWQAKLINEWISLRLAKQSDKKAREILTTRYKNVIKNLDKTLSDDVFQIYANAVTSVYDPHTGYYSPRSSEDFDIDMSLSLEGIGATLSIEEEMITIKELVEGGPAKKSGKLSRNDKILGVAQGDKGKMEDVVGWRLSDAVRLIRGKRGTVVRLRIEKGMGGDIVDVRLVRDKIKLEESAAKSEIKEIKKNGKTYRIGVIELPSFYLDFEAARAGKEDYRSTTKDVAKLIKKLEKDGIDGLLIDLRNNGGGSLKEVISLTGLFFDKGPVVQVRYSSGDIELHRDRDGDTLYNGPLAVLINENSASASEIFAGAIKDYGRGIILGEPTYGKGTVQSIIDLSDFIPSVEANKIGQLKITIAMFYRINGSSTQIKGVKPNIYIPNKESYEPGGESEEDHALPWQKIDAASDYAYNDSVEKIVPQLQHIYDTTNKNNPMMKTLIHRTQWFKKQEDDTLVSLSLKKRRVRRQDIKDKTLAFENAFRKLYGYPLLDKDYWNKEDKDKTDKEIELEKEQKVDPVLSIATDTMGDYIDLIK